MTRMLGPRFPINQAAQIAADLPSPLFLTFSGEITATSPGHPLGACGISAKVRNVWLSVLGKGKINVNPLSIAADVLINGTSCLTTQPIIAASSATSTNGNTLTSGTGITQAVVDGSANTITPGDFLSCDLTLVRTASPTTEINNVTVVVEIEPV